mmetsp:Transcript_788/g.1475  ORF Transcript_788/g.1475 Transcript_788/m.1475 type:complete len:324 (+) Transcript_788:49-1020(+)
MAMAFLTPFPTNSVAAASPFCSFGRTGVQSKPQPDGTSSRTKLLLAGILGLGGRCCRIPSRSFLYGEGASNMFAGVKPRVQILEKAAKMGDFNAQYACGEAYYNGERVKQNLPKAAHYFRMAAEQGLPKAQYFLGQMLLHGEGMRPNRVEGFTFMSLAAQADIVEAKYAVGTMLLSGEHVPKDAVRAIANLQAAADAGIKEAYCPLGMAYLETSSQASDAKAQEMWGAHYLGRAATDATDSKAQYELGKVYLYGTGAEKDPNRAAELISTAANMGLTSAQHHMAMLLLLGNGVEKNEEWAKYWLQEAAKQGCTKSQEQLNSMA